MNDIKRAYTCTPGMQRGTLLLTLGDRNERGGFFFYIICGDKA
jgi:hypothetical protein